MKRITLYSLAGVGTIALLLIACVSAFVWLMGRGGDTYTVEWESLSPNQTHKAILATGMGGGAAGWCSQFIVVAPPNAQTNDLLDKNSQKIVFATRCNTKVAATWANDSELLVKYRVSSDLADGATSASMRATDRSGQVVVKYEPEA